MEGAAYFAQEPLRPFLFKIPLARATLLWADGWVAGDGPLLEIEHDRLDGILKWATRPWTDRWIAGAGTLLEIEHDSLDGIAPTGLWGMKYRVDNFLLNKMPGQAALLRVGDPCQTLRVSLADYLA